VRLVLTAVKTLENGRGHAACDCWGETLAIGRWACFALFILCTIALLHLPSACAELEAALQAVGEAQGALANQHATVLQQEEETATEQRQQEEQQQQGWQQEWHLHRANLGVQRQLLEQQGRHAAACWEKLGR
jgi:hypothetical protein